MLREIFELSGLLANIAARRFLGWTLFCPFWQLCLLAAVLWALITLGLLLSAL